MSHINLALIDFMLADTVKLLELIVVVTLPIAFVGSIGIAFFLKRAKRRS
jgi:hypothetical protein